MNPIQKAHLEGVETIEISARCARCDKHDQDGTLVLSQTCPNCIAVKNAYIRFKSFLPIYAESILKAALEAGGEKRDVYHLPDYDPIRLRNIGFNDCLSTYRSTINEGIKLIK